MAHIFLYGPPGSGKSTLGQMLAARLALPFLDLDHAIEAKAGAPIPQIMAERGEAAFRDLEASTLDENLDARECVIALGGGTLLRDENRLLAESRGVIVCLTARPEVLLQRLQDDPRHRPLLAGDLSQRLTELLAARSAHYGSFALQVDANAPPAQLLWRIQMALGRFHLAAMGEYDVILGPGRVSQLGQLLREHGVIRPFLVTDENLAGLHADAVLKALRDAGYEPGLRAIHPGESSKTLETVTGLWRGFLEAGLDRQSTIVALGGGVAGDLAGFAASTFMRGIDWISVPTTLVSMADASIGGKTGFDLPEGKNLIGSFHPPRLVVIDPDLLATLPEVEFRSGMAEIVKHGVIADPELFDLCSHGPKAVRRRLTEILHRAVAVKVKIVEADPYERGQRASLNMGHTLGHAIELVSRFKVRHGEAVAIGMVAEARLAGRLGLAPKELAGRIAEALSSLGLPVSIPADLPRAELIAAMQRDKKKSGGVVHFALPIDIGCVRTGVEVETLELLFEEG